MYPESYRNYRIIKHKEKIKGIDEAHEWVGLYEVYYKNWKVVAWTAEPTITWDDIDDLIWELEYMLEDAKKCKEDSLIYTEKELEDMVKEK